MHNIYILSQEREKFKENEEPAGKFADSSKGMMLT